MENEWEIVRYSKWEGFNVFHTHKDMQFSCWKYYKLKCSLCGKVVPKHFITQLKLLDIKIPKFSPSGSLKSKGFYFYKKDISGRYRIHRDNTISLVPPAWSVSEHNIRNNIENIRNELENQI